MVGKLSFHFWWNPVSTLNYLETLSRGARFWLLLLVEEYGRTPLSQKSLFLASLEMQECWSLNFGSLAFTSDGNASPLEKLILTVYFTN